VAVAEVKRMTKVTETGKAGSIKYLKKMLAQVLEVKRMTQVTGTGSVKNLKKVPAQVLEREQVASSQERRTMTSLSGKGGVYNFFLSRNFGQHLMHKDWMKKLKPSLKSGIEQSEAGSLQVLSRTEKLQEYSLQRGSKARKKELKVISTGQDLTP
jgi:hypothetical protein